MFESAQGRSEASSSRLGTGAILSGGLHALVAALVLVLPGKTKAMSEEAPLPVIVEFVPPKIAGGGSSGPAQPIEKAAAAPKQKAAPVPIQEKPVPQPEEPQPEQPTPNSEPLTGKETAETAGPPGGGQGGGSGQGTGSGPGGPGPGTGNGSPEPTPTYTVINWNSKMERPVLSSGPAHPEYPRSAMLQHREGTVIVRCRITTDGSVRDCGILSGDVMLQQAALDALAQQRYRPLMYDGAPVSVWYQFRMTFKLQ